ncbi:MAG: hypothetical protein MI725_04010 [Pirellulales bacterium]|nr:hypothetical protein [Pirellulales bacterium]
MNWLEHDEVGAWGVAIECQSCVVSCDAEPLLSGLGVAGTGDVMERVFTEPPWYVIRMPGGVGGGVP